MTTASNGVPSLKEQISADLLAAGCKPLHRFGQNFMIDSEALSTLVGELQVQPGEQIVEIGPGTGVLTQRFLDAGARVLAVELDRGLHAHLLNKFAHYPLFTLVHGDALASKSRLHPDIETVAQQPWKLGANLPYDVSIPVLLNAVGRTGGGLAPGRMSVTIQREAADRLCSQPGQDAWGASAATLQVGGTPRMARKLSPQCFYPQPRVDSAILTWVPTAPSPLGFGAWCKSLFAYRRKVISRALRDVGVDRDQAQQAVVTLDFTETVRVEQLSVADLVRLFQAVGATP